MYTIQRLVIIEGLRIIVCYLIKLYIHEIYMAVSTCMYVGTSCVTAGIPTTGHVYDILLPDSFVYTYYYTTLHTWNLYGCFNTHVRRIKGLLNFQCYCRYTYYRSCICYLAVLCVCTTQHVYDISLPESFVCVHYTTCIWHFTTRKFCMCALQNM